MRRSIPRLPQSTCSRLRWRWPLAGLFAAALALSGCGAGDCTPGDSVSCDCDGATETVVCRDDGSQPPCVCGGGSHGSLDNGQITSGSLTWAKDDTTVFDTQTGLMWQRTPASDKLAWAAAVTYCDDLSLDGHDDWKLPHRDQLESIVLSLTTTPAIDTSAFPDTPAKPFWTRTLYGPNAAQEAFGVDFENGGTGHALMSEPHFVRCVRTPPLR